MTVIFGMEEKNENSNVIESVMTIRQQPNNKTRNQNHLGKHNDDLTRYK